MAFNYKKIYLQLQKTGIKVLSQHFCPKTRKKGNKNQAAAEVEAAA